MTLSDVFEQTAVSTSCSNPYEAVQNGLQRKSHAKPCRRSEVGSKYWYKPVLFMYRAEDYSRIRIHILPVKHSSPTRYAYVVFHSSRSARHPTLAHIDSQQKRAVVMCTHAAHLSHLCVLCGDCTRSLGAIAESLARLFARQTTKAQTEVVLSLSCLRNALLRFVKNIRACHEPTLVGRPGVGLGRAGPARLGPPIFYMMGRGPARPIKF